VKDEEELADLQKKIKSNSISNNASKGYTLKIDLEYPYILHSQHTNYPFASEKMHVKK
jgi:hypothetical protein